MQALFIYLAALNVIAVCLSVYDKVAAKLLPRHRVRERTLWLAAICGGALGTYLTMLIIRHKTKHRSFMIGLPIAILFHAVILLVILFFLI